MNASQMTQRSSIESKNKFLSDAIVTSTNKRRLIEQHVEHIRVLLKYNEIIMQKNDFCDVQRRIFGEISFNSCVLNAKNRVNLKTITSSKSHGKFLLCRILCPVLKLYDALITIVDDPEGELGVRLQLSNILRDGSYYSEEFLVGTMLAIIKPSYRADYDGTLHIRCYSRDEVVVLDKSDMKHIFPRLKWNGKLPDPSEFVRNENGNKNRMDWTRIGNEHFAFKRYDEAIVAYTIGIRKFGQSIDLLCHRSASYWNVSNYDAALTDAETVLVIDKNHVKAIYRKVKALFSMARYHDVLEFLNEIPLESIPIPDSESIVELKKQTTSFIAQAQDGMYCWKDIHTVDKPLDLANYTNEVIIKETTKKGRGLFAKKMILAGELILVSKAFAFVGDTTSNNISPQNPFTKNNPAELAESRKSYSPLALEIVKILTANPEKCKDLFCLYAGPNLQYLCECECDEEAKKSNDFPIDMQRIEAICEYNAFLNNVRSFNNNITSEPNHCGLWIIPSFINHSCIANSMWFRVQDYLFVKAFRNIAEGDEILISYGPPYFESFRQSNAYDFDCDCLVCERERLDNEKQKRYRHDLTQELFDRLRRYDSNSGRKRNREEILKIVKILKKTRNDKPQWNFIIVQPMLHLGMVLCLSGVNSEMEKGVDILEEVFEIAKNVATYNYTVVTACAHLVVANIRLKDILKVQHWIKTLVEKTIFAYGSLVVVESKFPVICSVMRECGYNL